MFGRCRGTSLPLTQQELQAAAQFLQPPSPWLPVMFAPWRPPSWTSPLSGRITRFVPDPLQPVTRHVPRPWRWSLIKAFMPLHSLAPTADWCLVTSCKWGRGNFSHKLPRTAADHWIFTLNLSYAELNVHRSWLLLKKTASHWRIQDGDHFSR